MRDLLLVAGIIRHFHGFCGAGISLPKRIGCCDEQVCSILGCQSRKVGRALNLENDLQKKGDEHQNFVEPKHAAKRPRRLGPATA